MENEPKNYTLEVSNPVSVVSTKFQNAPRLGDLNGKTICEWITKGLRKPEDPTGSDRGHWRASETFPIIEELLKKRFPDVKIIPGAELPGFEDYARHPELSEQTKLNHVTTAMKEKGCDAVILGNGG